MRGLPFTRPGRTELRSPRPTPKVQRRRGMLAWAAASAVLAVLLAACSSASPSPKPPSPNRPHGTITFADLPGAPPTYIFPFAPANQTSVANFQVIYMLWKPLYWFGNGTKAEVNYNLSLANPPVWSSNGLTVTITLKHYSWSNGQPLTSKDILFWWDMLEYEKDNFGNYQPGQIPDSVTSYSAPTPSTFTLTFNKAYSHNWILYNQLSLIIPMPANAWDKTSASEPVGDYASTAAGARAVYDFLNTQATDTATYATNPLWQVVDGPWQLSQFTSTTGQAAFVPNTHYSGPDKALAARFEMLPFTSDASEFDALRSGQVDYGYLPVEDVNQSGYLSSHGFSIVPWTAFGVTWMWLNYGNSAAGPIFNQLYVRQALQHLINQPQYIKDIFHGYAVPTYGPVPIEPSNPFVSPGEEQNPYPYSVSDARSLLSSHGWSTPNGGVATCERPGAGANECGSGVAAGATLSFTALYPSGQLAVDNEMAAVKSAFSAVGVQLTLHEEPQASVFTDVNTCDRASGQNCGWQIGLWGSPSIFYTPDNEPTGDPIFTTGGAFNAGSYSNAQNDAYVNATHLTSGYGPMFTYEDYLAKQLPGIWLPASPYQISVISKGLHGASSQNPYVEIDPSAWSLGS